MITKNVCASVFLLLGGWAQAQWTPIFTPGDNTPTGTLPTATLDDYSFFNGNGFVTVGYSYYLTTDNGASWSDWDDFWPYPLMKAAYYLNSTDVLVSGGGKVYKSVDAGLNFSQVDDPVSDINGMDMLGNFGVLVDNYCAAAYTTDGGNTWTTVSNMLLCGNVSAMRDAEVYDDGKAIIIGANSNAFRTTDWGASWSPYAVNGASNFTDVSFCSPLLGVAVVNDTAYQTSDGGASWTVLPRPAGAFSLQSAHRVDANTIYLTGDNVIYLSTDGGATFNLDFTNSDCNVCRFFRFRRQGGFLYVGVSDGGEHPKIYRTGVSGGSNGLEENAGLNLALYPNPAKDEIRVTGFSGALQATLVSLAGEVLWSGELQNEQALKVDFLAPGVYFLHAAGYSLKFIRQ